MSRLSKAAAVLLEAHRLKKHQAVQQLLDCLCDECPCPKQEDAGPGVSPADAGKLVKPVKDFLRQAAAEAGERVPKLDDKQILAVIKRLLAGAQDTQEACLPNKTGKGHHDDQTGHPCSPGFKDRAKNAVKGAAGKVKGAAKTVAATWHEKYATAAGNRATKVLKAAGGVTIHGGKAAARAAVETFRGWQKEYGTTGAVVITVAAAAMLPTPVPGGSLLPVYAARRIKAIVLHFSAGKAKAMAKKGGKKPPVSSPGKGSGNGGNQGSGKGGSGGTGGSEGGGSSGNGSSSSGGGSGGNGGHQPWHDQLPSDEDLEQATRTQVTGGTAPVYRLRLRGRNYFLKDLSNKPPIKANTEMAVNLIHRAIGLNTAPEMEIRGEGKVLTHELPGQELKQFPPGQPRRNAVHQLNPKDVVHTITANWLTHTGDRHAGNYLVHATQNGSRLFSIDNEISFQPRSPQGASAAVIDRLDELVSDLSEEQRQLPLSNTMLTRILDRQDHINEIIDDLVIQSYSDAQRKALGRALKNQMKARYKKVKALLKMKNPTLNDLLEE